MDDNALDCAVTMKSMVEKGINPIFKRRNIPRLKFRIGMDSGDALVTDIGDISAKLHKDLIGATISLTTKIQSCAEENQIVIGHTMLANLGVHRRSLFQEYEPLGWDYSLPNALDIYHLYELLPIDIK